MQDLCREASSKNTSTTAVCGTGEVSFLTDYLLTAPPTADHALPAWTRHVRSNKRCALSQESHFSSQNPHRASAAAVPTWIPQCCYIVWQVCTMLKHQHDHRLNDSQRLQKSIHYNNVCDKILLNSSQICSKGRGCESRHHHQANSMKTSQYLEILKK